MLTYLRRLTDERDSLTQSATDITERAAREERDVTDTERASLTTMQTRCAEIDGQLTEYNAQAESQRAYARLRDSLHTDDPEPAETPGGLPARRIQTRDAEVPQGWGELFVESPAFTNYPGAGTSQRVELPGGLETRAPITLGTVPQNPTIWTPPTPAFDSPLVAVCGSVTVSGNAVSFVQWTPNPQTKAPKVAEGTAKPEATMTATPTNVTLDTYAHWKEITRQALEDIPQIRSIVEGRLRQGLVRSVEEGIAAALVAATIPPATVALGGTLLQAIRIGLATVQDNGYRPNAVLLNPMDAADIDLGIMGGTLGGPAVNGSLWGLRVVPVGDIAAGTAFVGDFNSGVTVFSRGSTTVYLTDSHADNFIKNILLLLAEMRCYVAVPEPQAMAECSVSATTTAAAAGK